MAEAKENKPWSPAAGAGDSVLRSAKSAARAVKFDIDKALDDGHLSALTVWVVLVVAVAVILEAVGNNMLGLAIPKMMEEWGQSKDYFKWAVTISMFGMTAGAFISGFIADKIGRRKVILATLPICGIATVLIGLCTTITPLVILRFIVSFGYGGLLPVAASTCAEFSPKRWRTMGVTIPIACVALGTIVAGAIYDFGISLGGWHHAFYISGVLQLILLVILLFTLPESPRFMARSKESWVKLRGLLRRLGHKVADSDIFADDKDEAAQKVQKGGIGALFHDGLAGDTIAIWVVSFCGIAGLYAVYMWLPAMLTVEGVSREDAREAMAYWFSFGGLIGAFICAWGVSRFGSRKTMVLFAFLAAVTVAALLFFDAKDHISLLFIFLGLHGLFNNGIQVPLYAIFANLYPTHIRATGSSMASSVGKLGTIFAGFLGGMLTVNEYFIMLTVFMVLAFIALIVFKRHIVANKAA